ncbi:hypothetical protein CGLO_05087 [Colletotrichum gloeosporioides Cg-14]|uniref:Transcription factor domain-containing protein n=1 Tax=Colletotrichum gloeosporioides (strain Cg-14) TaxID=1237896 RepID=T0KSE9_COLGC|nr:hypothetical protein CGLO_05087 [Colletotrichum gloeosporioides Cg-14]
MNPEGDDGAFGDKAPVGATHSVLVPPPASTFAFVNFTENIDIHARRMLCTYYTHLKTNMYPIAKYYYSDISNTYWFHWTQLDLAYLHAVLYATSFFFDSLAGQKSERTKYHLYRTVSELNRQLSNPKTALTDSTTTVVMFMVFIAECFGDIECAHMHMMGLRNIIDLRGGLSSYDEKPLLQEKLRRADLIYSMCTGYKPAYSQNVGSSKCEGSGLAEPIYAESVDQSCFSQSRHLTRELDRGLHSSFEDVQVLSQLINSSHGSGEKLSDIVVEGFLTSIQSRLLLLDLHDHPCNPLAEILRLSLHAYLTTVF